MIGDSELSIILSRWEKVGALRTSNVTVPLSAISSVQRLGNARDGIRGIRAPGTGLPGVIALGTWRTRKAKDFVAATRDEPGYLIELDGQDFSRLVVSSAPVEELEALI